MTGSCIRPFKPTSPTSGTPDVPGSCRPSSHRSQLESVVADLIVILTEQALGAGDAKRITDLHAGEDLRYHVLVPADTDRTLLVDVIDHLRLLELRTGMRAGRAR